MTQRTLLSIVVHGDPKGKGRPKFARVGNFVRTYTPQATVDAEADVGRAAAMAWPKGVEAPYAEPCELIVRAVAARPKSMIPKEMGGSAPARAFADGRFTGARMWRTKKPDGDNVLKVISDGLVWHGCLRDDTFIVRWSCECLYATLNEGPRVEIELLTCPAR